ncbi:MAG: polyhydroxyalkanoate depolymerase [Hyphomicrobiales bacterium]|nr:polyhydroxyalkanoate depolymerase [Hyphomicrobiales bacterium]
MDRYSYQMYEIAHMALAPARAVSEATRRLASNPFNPWSHTLFGRNIAASAELFERVTRRYGKPAFGLRSTSVGGREVAVTEEVVWAQPFCQLLHFRRELPADAPRQSRLLVVAPMSGHYATLLRGTVETFLPTHDVYITDWVDARMTPLSAGKFDLDDYIDYVVQMCEALHDPEIPLHLVAVCQPSVPVLAAMAAMEMHNNPHTPKSMTLMGGPIDTRRSPTAVNKLAEDRGADWFRRNCIHMAPFPYPGAGRLVYPGFLQLSGFMAMNLDRHVNAHVEMFNHLVEGDGDSAEKHREFYDEYLAVMDLTAEFYLQTIEQVFVRHALPKGEFRHRGELLDLGAIRRVGLMTVEGEKDDISGVGQTLAAQDLCTGIPDNRRLHHLQADVGHYGVFNGKRFRSDIAPRICAFHQKMESLRG